MKREKESTHTFKKSERMIGLEQNRDDKKRKKQRGCLWMICAPVSSEALTALTSLRKHYPGGHARRTVPGPAACPHIILLSAEGRQPH